MLALVTEEFARVIAAVSLMILVPAFILETHRNKADRELSKERREELDRAEEALTTGEDQLSLNALWSVTHKRLDYYHQIATSQAKQSFRSAQRAMWVGVVLLIASAALAMTATTAIASIVTGTLGAASAAFAAFISRTFVRSQESSANHLRAYFDQPLEFSRYLAAERMIADLRGLGEEDRVKLAADVVRGILPAPAASDSAAGPEVDKKQ
ncbi:TRADD-N-associated membrane domain-containing protein [Nonomuraea sp. LPB2021202275-12-8]|uniref:TRADD-N-associated membrane domain-containing protein n=1 Tax=Nonomuraea sp. LPB2021202275-12-8 TaxID=3120159 RepID=UPI00300D0521